MNERLLRDSCEAFGHATGRGGSPSTATVGLWAAFIDQPTAQAWYRAHNASIVAAYLDHRDLAADENRTERFFLNVVLARLLYAHALVAAPRLALGRDRPAAAPFSATRAAVRSTSSSAWDASSPTTTLPTASSRTTSRSSTSSVACSTMR